VSFRSAHPHPPLPQAKMLRSSLGIQVKGINIEKGRGEGEEGGRGGGGGAL